MERTNFKKLESKIEFQEKDEIIQRFVYASKNLYTADDDEEYFMKTGHQKSINNKSLKSSSRRFPVKLFFCVTISTFMLVANTHAESLSIPDTSINYSDGVSDYFGVVDAGGVTINGTSFTPLETSPPSGSVAGRDIDDHQTKPVTQTAVWDLALGGGMDVDSVNFSGTLAAAEAGWPNDVGLINSIQLALNVNGVDVRTIDLRPDAAPIGLGPLREDTNADGVGDGILITASGVTINWTHPGGSSATPNVTLTATFTASSSQAEFWLSGTLIANSTPVELMNFSIE